MVGGSHTAAPQSIPLFERLRSSSGHLWKSYVEHQFVDQLGSGALPETAFRHYLSQDFLFLLHTARCNGLTMYKAQSLEELRAATLFSQMIMDEIHHHTTYCRSWGMSDDSLALTIEDPATKRYAKHLQEVVSNGDLLAIRVAMSPCVVGYFEIAERLRTNNAKGLHSYSSWIETYSGNKYQNAANECMVELDSLFQRYGGEQRMSELQQLFNAGLECEQAFWQMGLDFAEKSK